MSPSKNGAGLKPIEFTRGFMSFLIKACPIFIGTVAHRRLNCWAGEFMLRIKSKLNFL